MLRDTYDGTPKFDRRIESVDTRRVKNERDDDWAAELVKRVGKAMKDARNGRSATWLSDRTAELGYRVPATVISKLDSGHRGSVLGVAELVVLAAALDMPPVALLYPALPDGEVDLLPGEPVRSLNAVEWFRDTHRGQGLAARVPSIRHAWMPNYPTCGDFSCPAIEKRCRRRFALR